eukprot:COSAG04_NODE_3268_length_2991_cov_3.300830_3_plen_117_part_00
MPLRRCDIERRRPVRPRRPDRGPLLQFKCVSSRAGVKFDDFATSLGARRVAGSLGSVGRGQLLRRVLGAGQALAPDHCELTVRQSADLSAEELRSAFLDVDRPLAAGMLLLQMDAQ